MNKKLLALGTLVAVASPVAIVVACGTSKNSAQTPTTPNPTNGQAPIVPQSPADQPLVQITVENDNKATHDFTDMNSGMAGKITEDLSKLPSKIFSTPNIDFVLDTRANIKDEDFKLIIQDFFANENTGFGLLKDNGKKVRIFVLTSEMGSDGWGGVSQDLLIHVKLPLHPVPLESKVDEDDNNYTLQQILGTMQHEYGHHETTKLANTIPTVYGADQAHPDVTVNMEEQLVKDGIIGANIFQQALIDKTKNVDTEQGRLDAALKAMFPNAAGVPDVKDSTYFSSAFNFGPQGGWLYSPSYCFNIQYHFQNAMESLNRPMNLLEVATLYDKKYQYAGQILQADSLTFTANGTPAWDKDGNVTPAAKELVGLYAKDIYKYNDGLYFFNATTTIAGYTDSKIDFVKAYLPGQDENDPKFSGVAKAQQARSHFINAPNSIFDKRTVAYDGYATKITKFSGNINYKGEEFKFYQDTNKNGKLDSADAEVKPKFQKTP